MVSLNPPSAQRAATACRPMACSFANFLPLLLPLSRILSAYLPSWGMYIKALDNTWERGVWREQNTMSVSLSTQWSILFYERAQLTFSAVLVHIWAVLDSGAVRRLCSRAMTSAAMLLATWPLMKGRTGSELCVKSQANSLESALSKYYDIIVELRVV